MVEIRHKDIIVQRNSNNSNWNDQLNVHYLSYYSVSVKDGYY